MADFLVKLACWRYARKHISEFRASRPLEGNAAFMDADEQFWWGYKYYFGPIERAQPGTSLEEYFASQDLSFVPAAEIDEDSSVTLSLGGDILAHAGINPDSTRHLWEDVRDFYLDSDIVYANLETPLVPSIPGSYIPKSILEAPKLNTTSEMFSRIVEGPGGLRLFSTANNHCLDQGEEGLRATLDFLDSRGYPHLGTARSQEEAKAPFIIEQRGIKLGFLSFTFALNWKGLPEGREYLANYVRLNKPDADISPIAGQVAALRAAGADIIIALLHWSLEFEAYPAANIVQMGHRLIELGIDVIVGNHPHNVQPIEKYSWIEAASGKKRDGLIFYALGDLLSIHRTLPNSRLAMLARLRLSRDKSSSRTIISGLEVLPVYLYVNKHGNRYLDYRVLDIRKLCAELRKGRNVFKFSRKRIREIFRLESLMRKILGPALRQPGPWIS